MVFYNSTTEIASSTTMSNADVDVIFGLLSPPASPEFDFEDENTKRAAFARFRLEDHYAADKAEKAAMKSGKVDLSEVHFRKFSVSKGSRSTKREPIFKPLRRQPASANVLAAASSRTVLSGRVEKDYVPSEKGNAMLAKKEAAGARRAAAFVAVREAEQWVWEHRHDEGSGLLPAVKKSKKGPIKDRSLAQRLAAGNPRYFAKN